MLLSNTQLQTILVVDDDSNFRSSIRRILQLSGFNVLEAPDGQSALELFQATPIQIILSDYKMPKMNGGELLGRIRQISKVSFILMTGLSNVIEASEAYAAGATGFLSKPFTRDELLETLRTTAQSKPQQHSENDFCKLWVGDFVYGSQIRFPIFLKLSEGKFVKLGNSGEDLSRERIDKLIAKDIKHLYLKADDFRKYIDLSTQLTPIILTSDKINRQRKRKFLNQVNAAIFEYSFFKKLDEEIFESVSNNLEASLGLLDEGNDSFKLLNEYLVTDNERFSRAIGTSILSAMIGRSRKWEASSTITRLMLAGLFINIGESKLPERIQNQAPINRTKEDELTYRQHVENGREIVNQLKGVPADLGDIIYQHHEHWDGSGYPQGLCGKQIHPLARIVGMAQFVIEELKKKDDKSKNFQAVALATEKQTRFDPAIWKIFQDLVKK